MFAGVCFFVGVFAAFGLLFVFPGVGRVMWVGSRGVFRGARVWLMVVRFGHVFFASFMVVLVVRLYVFRLGWLLLAW